MLISFKHAGNFEKTTKFLNYMKRPSIYPILLRYAQMGQVALMENTPMDTGQAANSWGFVITQEGFDYKITWTNNDLDIQGVPIVILVQYGHATNGGAYVQGYDFINPTLKSIFDNLTEELWKEVISA